MRRHLERLRRVTWNYKQPLTLTPGVRGAPVSDLFVWRRSADWETFFELTDMPALFSGEESAGRRATLIFFDAAGRSFLEKTVEVAPGRRNTLALSELIGDGNGEVGTFCVFHSHTPENLIALGSHLAERGYVSYRYRGAPLRAYVHGNLDAAARLPGGTLQRLGGSTLRAREYRLQHLLSDTNVYELALVNATDREQRIVCRTLDASGRIAGSEMAVSLLSGGCYIFTAAPQGDQQRIVISSHLAMARPLIFRIQNQTMDVFHG